MSNLFVVELTTPMVTAPTMLRCFCGGGYSVCRLGRSLWDEEELTAKASFVELHQ